MRKIRDEADDLERWCRLTARQRRQRYWQERYRGWTHAGLVYVIAGVSLPPEAVRVLGLPVRTAWGSPWSTGAKVVREG
jgi:hypothetical protein